MTFGSVGSQPVVAAVSLLHEGHLLVPNMEGTLGPKPKALVSTCLYGACAHAHPDVDVLTSLQS